MNGDAEYDTAVKSIIPAIKNGDTNLVKAALNSVPLIHLRKWNDGYSLLQIATQWNRSEIVKFLLERGSKVNIMSDKNTPLHFAVRNGSTDIIQTLLSKNAKINAKNSEMETPLQIALDTGNEVIIDLLIENGALLEIGDLSKLLAVKKDYIKTVDLLLRKRSFSYRNYLEELLDFAVKEGLSKVVEKLLIFESFIKSVYIKHYLDGCTHLHLAVLNCNYDIVKLLLSISNQIDINSKGRYQITPLHIASEKGRSDIIDCLLKKVANVNSVCDKYYLLTKDKYCSCPLSDRTLFNNSRVLSLPCCSTNETVSNSSVYHHDKCLFTKDIDESGFCESLIENCTPLDIALETGNLNIVDLLLKNGAKLNTEIQNGKTVLYRAIEKQNVEMVEVILKNKPDIKNIINKICLKTAVMTIDFCDHNHCDYIYPAKKLNLNKRFSNQYTCRYKIISMLLDYGFTIDPDDAKNSRFLLEAIIKGCPEIVEFLLKYGAKIKITDIKDDEIDKTCCEFLPAAVINKHFDLAELLLQSGVNVNAKDNHNQTALYYSVQNNDFQMTNKLLSHGANVNLCSNILHTAAINNNEEIVRLLIEYHANVNGEDEHRNIPLVYAVKNKNVEMTKLFLINSVDQIIGFTVLKCAIMDVHEEVIEVIFQYGKEFDVNSCDNKGRTPLHYVASSYKKIECDYQNIRFKLEIILCKIVKFLLDKGANVNAQTVSGETPLIRAVRNGHRNVVKILLDNNADINLYDKFHLTPLLAAVEKRNEVLVEILLAKGANVNFKRRNGNTALHLAADRRDSYRSDGVTFICMNSNKIIELLLNYKADVNSINKKRETPLLIATKTGNHYIVDNLLKFGADISFYNSGSSLLLAAVEQGNEKVVEILLAKGADVNFRRRDGNTAFHVAVGRRGLFDSKSRIVKLLLNYKADVNAMNNNWETPLLIAARIGNYKIVDDLLESGADIDVKDKNKKTALYIAAKAGNREVVKLLLNCGPDVNIIYEKKQTVFQCFLKPSLMQIFRRHMMKMTAADMYVNDKNLQFLSQSIFNEDFEGLHAEFQCAFEEGCLKEVETLKSVMVTSDLSLYDILTESFNQLKVYARNENLVKAFESTDCKKLFSIYGSMIEYRFKNAVKINYLLNECIKFLYSQTSDFIKLPYNCTEKIFCLISNDDLRRVLISVKPPRILSECTCSNE